MVSSVLFPKKHKGPQSQVSWGSLGKEPLKKVAPEVGLEPTTNRLTADRSTTELLRIEKGRSFNRG